MKLETVLVKEFCEPSHPRVGYLQAVLSPEGWEQSTFYPADGYRLSSAEIAEFSNLIMSFIHECKTQNDLKKFCKKYGTDTDAVTCSFRFDLALLTYIVHVTGYSVTFIAIRYDYGREENA